MWTAVSKMLGRAIRHRRRVALATLALFGLLGGAGYAIGRPEPAPVAFGLRGSPATAGVPVTAVPSTATPSPIPTPTSTPMPPRDPGPGSGSGAGTATASAGSYVVYGSNTYRYAAGNGPVAGTGGTLRRYRVAVEDGVGATPEEFADWVESTLSDPRSWIGGGSVRPSPHESRDAWLTVFV